MNVFEKAALLIRTPDRWAQAPNISDNRLCVGMALERATDGDHKEQRQAYRVMADVVSPSGPKWREPIDMTVRWNDVPGRTFDQVHDALEEAARRVRDQEAAFATYDLPA